MSLTFGGREKSLLAIVARRVRQDVQFSRIFLVDLCATLGFTAATAFFVWRIEPADFTPLVAAIAAYAVLFLVKIALVVRLETKGGDAREFVGSETLVSDGAYAFSRNPVYVAALLQSAVWAAGLVGLVFMEGPPCVATLGAAAAVALLCGHYWGMDRLVIPHEEAALRARHPQSFDAYCARVRRWFGRR
jgi:protein-S-isoprenylcysteine O-methyltransferase Ste14